MRRVLLFILTPLLIAISLQIVEAKVKIDLKTKLLDKKGIDYQVMKAGIKAMIQQDLTWVELVEVFEKYSLWIKDANISPKPGEPMTNRVTFTLELRTPAMIGNGKLIDARQIQFDFDTQNPLPFANRPQLERSITNLQGKFNAVGGNSMIAMVGTGGVSVMASFAISVGKVLQKEYTPAQQTLGALCGFHTIGNLYEMLKKTGDVQ